MDKTSDGEAVAANEFIKAISPRRTKEGRKPSSPVVREDVLSLSAFNRPTTPKKNSLPPLAPLSHTIFLLTMEAANNKVFLGGSTSRRQILKFPVTRDLPFCFILLSSLSLPSFCFIIPISLASFQFYLCCAYFFSIYYRLTIMR